MTRRAVNPRILFVTSRLKVGALLLDLPRLLSALYGPARLGAHWTRYGNRRDLLTSNRDGPGVRCEWEFSRQLHLCNVFPATARWLLRRSLRECPIAMAAGPDHAVRGGTCWNGGGDGGDALPEVSFLVGHRGMERLPHLLLTLKSIASQQGVRFECIVVEQDVAPTVRGKLPEWVQHVHAPGSGPDMPYSRSRAFNVAAARARAALLVFHDNDLLVPERYGADLLMRFGQRFEVINLKRFIFYLDWDGAVGADPFAGPLRLGPEGVVENAEAGGSLAVARHAFESIGGFDEQFVGWGGEDIEFWDRCLTRRTWRYGFLPLVHLRHPAQPGKRAVRGLGLLTAELAEHRRAIDPDARIAELVKRRRGRLSSDDSNTTVSSVAWARTGQEQEE